jgi:hypothetical protein
VRVKPRAARDEIAGEREGALLVRLTAPPVEGEANAALVRLLSRALGLPPSSIVIAQGAKGRDKVLVCAGLGAADLRARLSAAQERR